MTEDLEAIIEARKRQAKDREITKKAKTVAVEMGTPPHSPKELSIISTYTNNKISIFYHKSRFWERREKHFRDEVKIYVDESEVYHDIESAGFDDINTYRTNRSGYWEYDGISGIKTYKPGEWETHLDELYSRISQAKAEILARETDEKLRKEQQEKQKEANEEQNRKLKEIESKKKNFGL